MDLRESSAIKGLEQFATLSEAWGDRVREWLLAFTAVVNSPAAAKWRAQ